MLSGSAAGGKNTKTKGGKGASAADNYVPQYQGLLQAPRLPGMLDHQHGGTPDSPKTVELAKETQSGFAQMRGPADRTA